MASRFAWIDVDEASRRTMLDFIDRFRDQGTLDELGIGTIRDAFADYFFPGTSTVQTRARYFLFVSWIYRRLEERRVPSSEIARRLRSAELELLNAMLEAGVGEGERLIGRQSGVALKRWPSNIYWAGLHRWGIRRFPGSQEQYHRWLDGFYRRRHYALEALEGELGGEYSANWDPDPHFPEIPEGFPKGVTMNLRREDAEYLVHRIRMSCQGSLLAALLRDAPALKADAVWLLPRLSELSDDLRTHIENARWFALAMHGANLLYYCCAASEGGQSQRAKEAEGLLGEWTASVSEERIGLSAWAAGRSRFWGSEAFREIRIPDKTRRFVEAWVDCLLADGLASSIWKNAAARQLIKDRERETKGEPRARLWSRQRLESWDPSGPPIPLEYRWTVARWMLKDILDGLNAKQDEDLAEV